MGLHFDILAWPQHSGLAPTASRQPRFSAREPLPWQPLGMPDFRLFGDEHVRKYEETGGEVGHAWNGTHVLILHAKGRKSGQIHKVPLIYGRDGDDYLIVASKGGAAKHPGWYLNLLAHPEVTIQVLGEQLQVRTHTATPAEKPRLWPIMTKEWPDYDRYQAKTERDIPLVVLSPC